MRTFTVNLGNNKGDKNNDSSLKLTHLHNTLLINIVNTPEKYLSCREIKSAASKVRPSSLNSSSALFSCSIRVIYNIVHCAQK